LEFVLKRHSTLFVLDKNNITERKNELISRLSGQPYRVATDTIGAGQSLMPFFNTVTSPATNFLVAFGFGLLGTLSFALFGQDLGYAPILQKEKE